MPLTVYHALTATTPDDPSYEIKPQADWNAAHVASLSISGSELSAAFSNSNGVSFGLAPNGQLTASYTVPTQSNQAIGGFVYGNTVINSSSTFDARSLGISGVGIISVGLVGGNFIISATGGGAGGVAIAAGIHSISSGTAAFGNANNVTFGMDTAGNVTASASYSTGIVVGASNAALQVSSIVFSNSNGMSFGLSNQTLTASYSVPNINGLISGVNVSANGSTGLLSQISFSNANNLTFGLNGSTVTASYSQTTSPTSVFGVGNTTQNSSGTHSPGSLYLSGAGNISVGVSGNTYILSAVGSAPAGGIALGAGGNTTNTGTVIFSNSNGVTFGMNTAGVVTATVNPGPAAGIGAVSAGSQLQTTGSLIFSNSNGISFGLSASSILTAAYSVPTQTTQPVAVSGSNGSLAFSTLSLGNSNGLSFYTSNGSVVGSYSVPSVAGLLSAFNVSAGTAASNETGLVFSNSNGVVFGLNGATVTASVVYGGLSVSAGTSASAVSGVTFSNANGVSFGLNNGTITASVATATQSNQSLGVYVGSNTLGVSSATYNATSLPIAGAGLVSVGNTLGSVLISGAGIGISAGANSVSSGSVVFSNSNGVSFGMATNGVVTGSVQPAGIVVSAGVSSSNVLSLILSNANNVNFGLAGNTLTASAVPSINVSAGTASNALSSLVFSNSNGVSFGLNASTVTASVNVGAAVSQSLYAVGNTTGSSSTVNNVQTLSVSGAGAVSVGVSGGALVISAAPGAQSAQTLGVYGSSNVTGTSFATVDARSLTLVGGGVISVGNSNGSVLISGPASTSVTLLSAGFSNLGNTAGLSGMAASQLVVVGGSNITLSGSTNAGGSVTMSIIGSGGGNGTLSFYAGGNTTGASTGSLAESAFSVVGSGLISVGMSNGSLMISAPVTTSIALLSAGFSTLGNTLGMSGLASQQLVFAGSNNITLSGSTSGGSMTMSILGVNYTALSAATQLAGTEVGPSVQNTNTVKITEEQRAQYNLQRNVAPMLEHSQIKNTAATLTVAESTTAMAGSQTISPIVSGVINPAFNYFVPYSSLVQKSQAFPDTTTIVSIANPAPNSSVDLTFAFNYTGTALDIIKLASGLGFLLWVDDVYVGNFSEPTTGTAQGGSTTTITLATGASATNGQYVNYSVSIQSGTGAGQVNQVASYVGSTKVATMAANWTTAPDNTSVYYIVDDVHGYYSPPSGGSTTYINLSWPVVSTHKIEIECNEFHGINIGQHDTIWPAIPAGALRCVYVGDSFVGGTGGPYRTTPYMKSILPRDCGWQSWSDGAGGTGWVAAPATGSFNYIDRIAPPNEAWQFIINGATGGTFTLSVTYASSTQTTSALAYNASYSTVQTAIQALSNVPASSVVVGVTGYGSGGWFIIIHGASGATLTYNTSGLTGTVTPTLTQWLGSVKPRIPLDGAGNALPFILFVQGSGNDFGGGYTATQVQNNATTVAQYITANFPTAITIFTGVVAVSTQGGGAIASGDVAFNTAIKTAAGYLPLINGQVPFIDTYAAGIGANAWICGTGNVASPTNAKNDILISITNVGHPTGDGHSYLASRLTQTIKALLGAY